MIQESEQSSIQYIKSHIDQTAKQTGELFVSSIEQLRSSVVIQIRSDTRTIINSLQHLESSIWLGTKTLYIKDLLLANSW